MSSRWSRLALVFGLGLLACAEERPATPTVLVLATASGNGEIGPCG